MLIFMFDSHQFPLKKIITWFQNDENDIELTKKVNRWFFSIECNALDTDGCAQNFSFY